MVGVNKEYNIIISLSHAWLKYDSGDSTVMINALHCMHLSIIIPDCIVVQCCRRQGHKKSPHLDWDLGTWVIHKYNKSVEVGDKLATICLESSGTAYKHQKQCILVGHRSHAHRPCPLCICMCFLLMCMTGLVQVKVVDSICPSCMIMQMSYVICPVQGAWDRCS